MKLLLDENLIPGFAAILQELGFSAKHVYHVQLRCLITMTYDVLGLRASEASPLFAKSDNNGRTDDTD